VTIRKGGAAPPGTRVPWRVGIDRTYTPAVAGDEMKLVLGRRRRS